MTHFASLQSRLVALIDISPFLNAVLCGQACEVRRSNWLAKAFRFLFLYRAHARAQTQRCSCPILLLFVFARWLRPNISYQSAGSPSLAAPCAWRNSQARGVRCALSIANDGLHYRSSQMMQNRLMKPGRTTRVNQTAKAKPMLFIIAPTNANARRLRLARRPTTANASPVSRGAGTKTGDQISQSSSHAVPGTLLTAMQAPMTAVVIRKTAQDAMPALECPMALPPVFHSLAVLPTRD